MQQQVIGRDESRVLPRFSYYAGSPMMSASFLVCLGRHDVVRRANSTLPKGGLPIHIKLRAVNHECGHLQFGHG